MLRLCAPCWKVMPWNDLRAVLETLKMGTLLRTKVDVVKTGRSVQSRMLTLASDGRLSSERTSSFSKLKVPSMTARSFAARVSKSELLAAVRLPVIVLIPLREMPPAAAVAMTMFPVNVVQAVRTEASEASWIVRVGSEQVLAVCFVKKTNDQSQIQTRMSWTISYQETVLAARAVLK